jgi:hypothetical protein
MEMLECGFLIRGSLGREEHSVSQRHPGQAGKGRIHAKCVYVYVCIHVHVHTYVHDLCQSHQLHISACVMHDVESNACKATARVPACCAAQKTIKSCTHRQCKTLPREARHGIVHFGRVRAGPCVRHRAGTGALRDDVCSVASSDAAWPQDCDAAMRTRVSVSALGCFNANQSECHVLSKSKRADIYIYMCVCVYIYIYMYDLIAQLILLFKRRRSCNMKG